MNTRSIPGAPALYTLLAVFAGPLLGADELRAQDLALNELERQRRTEARRRQLEGKRKAAD